MVTYVSGMNHHCDTSCTRNFDEQSDALVAKKLRAKSDWKEIHYDEECASMIKSKAAIALIEEDEGLETAAILASPSPLDITATGTFPLSLIAFGQIRHRHFRALTLRPKKTRNSTEEIESPPEIEIAARTEQIETTAPFARAYPATHHKTSRLRTSHSPSLSLQHAKVDASGFGASLGRRTDPSARSKDVASFEGVATGEQANLSRLLKNPVVSRRG